MRENSSLHNADESGFLTLLKQDSDRLVCGQTHALLQLTLIPSEPSAAKPVLATEHLKSLVREYVPDSVSIFESGPGTIAIWLQKAGRNDAIQLARLLRNAVTTRHTTTDDARTSEDSEVQCAIGVVIVNRANWQAQTLVATAAITAGIARLSGTNSIRVADQVAFESERAAIL